MGFFSYLRYSIKQSLWRVLAKLFILLSPILILFVIVEYLTRYIPNSIQEKKQLFETRIKFTEVLVLGASHALYGINPDYFSCSGFNLSNVSQSLFYDTEITMKYLDRLTRLKAVIITIFYPSFWFELSDSFENWRDYLYFRSYGIKYPGLKVFTLETISYAAIYPRKLLIQFCRDPTRFTTEKLHENGWILSPPAQDVSGIDDIAGLDRFKYHHSLVKRSNLFRNLHYLARIMAELQKRNIKIFFVTVPVYKTYSKYIDQKIENENHRVIDELCSRYGCKYFDYSKDSRFIMSDFYDSDHLNREGAKKFSMILNKDFVSEACKTQ